MDTKRKALQTVKKSYLSDSRVKEGAGCGLSMAPRAHNSTVEDTSAGKHTVQHAKNKKQAVENHLFVYPKQFGEKEIKYFEILASKLTSSEKENLRSKNQRKSYSKYEDALICLAPSLNIGPSELADIFRSNPYCSERSSEALDRRRYVLNSKGVLDKLFRKTAKQIYGEIKGISFKKSVRQAGKAAAAVFGKKEAAQSVLFDNADPEEKEIRPLKEQEERKKEDEITEISDKSYTYYTYPDRFTQEDINRLEDILAGRRKARFEEKGVTRRTKMSYTEYDRDFLLTCIERGYKFEDIFAIFGDNPFLTPRKYEGLKAKFYEYRKASDISGYKEHMEQEYARARVPEDRKLPESSGIEIELAPVTPEINAPEVDEADMAVSGHMFENKNMGAVLFSEAYTYKRMKDHTDLYKHFKKRNRQVDSNKPKMLFVTDIARYLNMSNEAAADYVDSMSAVGLPFKREGKEVLLIEPDSILGGNMPNFRLDIPSLDIGGGVKCTPIGLISDTHYGAEGCAEDLVRRYYRIAYERFHVRCFLHAGDLVDGNGVYPGQPFEQNRIGFDQQLRMAAELYPYYPDVMTYAIGGNHDESYIKNAGANIINALHLRRKDIVPLGIYQALVSVNGFHINLHHANGSCSALLPESKLNSIAQRKQYIVDNFGFNVDRLDLVVVGHYHQRGFLTDRSKYLVDTLSFGGTFEKPSSFVKRSFDMTNILSGYVAHLYRFPNGKKRIMLTEIPFDISKEEGHSQPKTVDLPFCDNVYGEVYANAS